MAQTASPSKAVNGNGYKHCRIQLFLRYFVIVNAIILPTNGFEPYKNPTAA